MTARSKSEAHNAGDYLVITNYHIEGYRVERAHTFQEAIDLRDESMGNGNEEVFIAKLVRWTATETT